jgi:SAM-dependent methyltransferase
MLRASAGTVLPLKSIEVNMFFPEKIISIRKEYRVLEIGPGCSPHPRSDAFLELEFNTVQDKIAQRGGALNDANFGIKPVYFYDGKKFPFEDNQFDYVICSHVVEHVEDPEAFLNEIIRVGRGRGYLEYPLITYEYLYNFNVHLHFVKFDFDAMKISYLPKSETSFSEYSGVSSLFHKTLEYGWDDLCSSNKSLFFEGFEFNQPFVIEKTRELNKLLPPQASILRKSFVRKLFGRIADKLGL